MSNGDGVKIELEWSKPLKELRENFEKAADILTDFERLADQALFPALRSHVTRTYATQGGAAGKKWADYSNEPKYAAYKASVLDRFIGDSLPIGRNTSGGLLRWAGQERLYPSLTDRTHPEHVEEASGMSGEFGTTVGYARRLFETGGTGPFGESYPARPLFRNLEEGPILRGAEQWFRNELKEAGLL